MKIYVNSAENDEDFNIALADIEGLAYKLGYELEIKYKYQIALTAKRNADMMPTITVNSDIEDNTYSYNTIIEFPTFNINDIEKDYMYWIEMWASLSPLIDKINKFKYLVKG